MWLWVAMGFHDSRGPNEAQVFPRTMFIPQLGPTLGSAYACQFYTDKHETLHYINSAVYYVNGHITKSLCGNY